MEAGRARDRDQVLTNLYLEHYDSLRRLAYVMLGEGALAEEIVMEAFAKAMTKWSLFSKVEHPPAYMRQIVVNLCRSKVRRKILERRVSEKFEREAREEIVRGADTHGDELGIWAAVRRLPERQRACVVLRYLDDLSEPEIADVLDIPVGTVKSQLSRARRKLSDWLGADIEEAAAS